MGAHPWIVVYIFTLGKILRYQLYHRSSTKTRSTNNDQQYHNHKYPDQQYHNQKYHDLQYLRLSRARLRGVRHTAESDSTVFDKPWSQKAQCLTHSGVGLGGV